MTHQGFACVCGSFDCVYVCDCCCAFVGWHMLELVYVHIHNFIYALVTPERLSTRYARMTTGKFHEWVVSGMWCRVCRVTPDTTVVCVVRCSLSLDARASGTERRADHTSNCCWAWACRQKARSRVTYSDVGEIDKKRYTHRVNENIAQNLLTKQKKMHPQILIWWLSP